MPPSEIYAALKAKGYSVLTLSEALGTTRQYIYTVIGRSQRSLRIAKALAAILDVNIKDIFPDVPEYYGPTRKERKAAAVADIRSKLLAKGLTSLTQKRSRCRAKPSRASA